MVFKQIVEQTQGLLVFVGKFFSFLMKFIYRPQEFQKCGDMVQFGNFGAVSRCNWIYIQYQVRSRQAVGFVHLVLRNPVV